MTAKPYPTPESTPPTLTVPCLSLDQPPTYHNLAYRVWGPAHASADVTTVVCVHGLTRNGHDFDWLAHALCSHPTVAFRVVTVDVAGRGRSSYLRNPALYGYPQYVSDLVTLLARVTAGQPDGQGVLYVGTSMGGLIGVNLCAALGDAMPIRAFVVNDIGPVLCAPALNRIASYVGKGLTFDTLEEVDAYCRQTYPDMDAFMTDEQWRYLAEHSATQGEDGLYTLDYDQDIRHAFADKEFTDDLNMWPLFDLVKVPTLVLRGGKTKLWPVQAATEWGERDNITLITLPQVGHPIPFTCNLDIEPVVAFLAQHAIAD